MASKRMFEKSIIENDWFMDLSMGAKALYFLLGMEADDEGFVSPKRVIRIYGGSEDDLNLLIFKKFVIRFESGVIVITDWKENNYLDKNRIKETKYLLEKSMIECNNNKYQLRSQVKQMLNKCSTSIEESRVEENRIEYIIPPSENFENFWKTFPHARKGKKEDARKEYKKNNVDDVDNEVKLLSRKIEIGQQDPNFIPACERWIRDFTKTSDLMLDGLLINAMMYLRSLEGEKRVDVNTRLKIDFGEEIINEYWNKTKTKKITLKFKDDNGKVTTF